jgi:hypothetical protein
MQRQSEPREELAQVGEEAFGFRPVLESHDEIIGETHDHAKRATSYTWCRSAVNRCFLSRCAACRTRSSALGVPARL